MSTELPAATAKLSTPTAPQRRTTRLLLMCGVVAGPLFVITTIGQAIARDGFDPARHPLSLLSLSEQGWLQAGNFVVSGCLVLASAFGLRRSFETDPDRSRWGPILFAVYGISLIWAGVFRTDPAEGYPIGTPDGPPTDISWHGMLHNFAPVGMGLALVVACGVFGRRYAAQGRRGWAIYSALAAAGYLVLSSIAFGAGDFRWMLAGGAVIWTWASAVCAHQLWSKTLVDQR